MMSRFGAEAANLLSCCKISALQNDMPSAAFERCAPANLTVRKRTSQGIAVIADIAAIARDRETFETQRSRGSRGLGKRCPVLFRLTI